jgi:hypothetical protein
MRRSSEPAESTEAGFILPEPEPPLPRVPWRSPVRAALYSAFMLGGGQIYNKQLERAILLWLWGALLGGAGAALLVLGALGRSIQAEGLRPPFGDWIADHAVGVTAAWVLGEVGLWAGGVRDAWTGAGRVNRGEVVVQYSLRRQMVHVLASQLLAFIPVVGLFFPPGVVAEAIDAARQRRVVHGGRMVRHGGQALLEWALVRAAFYGFWALLALWGCWWLARITGVKI